MRFSILTSALALASTSLAAPTPTNASLQKGIQTLEVTIVNVLNDIVQSNKPQLSKDFEAGHLQFSDLISKVSGPQSCSPFVPGKPKTKKGAVNFLQKSLEGLQTLSLDLNDPSKSIEDSDFHADVCVAWGYYWGDATFVGY